MALSDVCCGFVDSLVLSVCFGFFYKISQLCGDIIVTSIVFMNSTSINLCQ